jgi:hypothetical protein
MQVAHATACPQLFVTLPHLPFWHVTVDGCGMHPQTPLTPPPPQVCPVPEHVVEHCTVWPQLFTVGPHLPEAHVVAMGSSVHVLQRPVAVAQPKGHGVSDPQSPVAPQVCAVELLHLCAFGTQTPPHFPVEATQMFMQVVPAS